MALDVIAQRGLDLQFTPLRKLSPGTPCTLHFSPTTTPRLMILPVSVAESFLPFLPPTACEPSHLHSALITLLLLLLLTSRLPQSAAIDASMAIDQTRILQRPRPHGHSLPSCLHFFNDSVAARRSVLFSF
uniref:Uncharacterized protein n=1 Tax=Physcomitrium patens TaxID=3218 RepID=A0A2K1L7D0_PHYPA|nr:hypothetical protein PHYPA_000328 [Physcomitrium patens]